MKDPRILIEFSDHDFQDRWITAPISILKEFKERSKTQNQDEIWDWFLGLSNFGDEPNKPVHWITRVDHNMDSVFLAWSDWKTCIEEWELD